VSRVIFVFNPTSLATKAIAQTLRYLQCNSGLIAFASLSTSSVLLSTVFFYQTHALAIIPSVFAHVFGTVSIKHHSFWYATILWFVFYFIAWFVLLVFAYLFFFYLMMFYPNALSH
jgi:hypothetical protein